MKIAPPKGRSTAGRSETNEDHPIDPGNPLGSIGGSVVVEMVDGVLVDGVLVEPNVVDVVDVVVTVVDTVVEVDDDVLAVDVVVDAVEVVDCTVDVVVETVVLVVLRVDPVLPLVVVDPGVDVEVIVASEVEVVPAPVFATEVVDPESPGVDVVVGLAYSESTGPSPGSSGVDPDSQATPSLSASRLSR